MTSNSISLIKDLTQVVGPENVILDEKDRKFYSTDVYRSGSLPDVVVRPSKAEHIQNIAKLANSTETPIFIRGGGASYTDAYTPNSTGSILLETSHFADIIELNEVDMYVTVQPGITWEALDAALKPKGLRTPFWGPFSGLVATVGGSVSQHSLSHGSSAFGISAESVVSMDIVLPNGELLRTGSASHQNMDSPFYRYSGPDLTGLFTGDCGALGIKTSITLRLIKRKESIGCESFSFETYSQLQEAMAEVARAGLADENFALDPALQEGQIARQDMGQMFKTAWQVFKSSTNPISGLITLLKMATAGRNFLKNGAYSAHWILDGVNKAEVNAKASALRAIAMKYGVIIPNSMPTVVASMPFAPLYNILGPRGERWVPIHGVLPFSKAHNFHKKWQALLVSEAANMKKYNVTLGTMFATISTNAFLYEIAFYWQDERSVYHNTMLPEEHLNNIPKYEASNETRTYLDQLKQKAVEIYSEEGAVHFQIGKAYPFLSNQRATSKLLLTSLKKQLDPKNILNPSALGL